MRTVRVALGDRSYSILIGRDLLAGTGSACRKAGLPVGRCAVIVDQELARRYGRPVMRSLRAAGYDPALVSMPAGEPSKQLRTVGECYAALAAHRLERGSFVVALGGGVVGDLAGFAAATYLRGVALVQIPTTLLAQVDSSVGGKVGVNLPAGKNLVGAFHQPRLVICDLDTLKTLPERELRAGLAEVIKYGIIADARLFRRLEREMPRLLKREARVLEPVIARSCAIKAEVVSQDEREGGLRAILNFGHTVGHAIEAVTRYGRYLHGEAISIGQVAAARLSVSQCGLSEQEADRIRDLFQAAGLPVRLVVPESLERRLLAAMRLDKKVRSGEVRFVLAHSIGTVEHGLPVPEAEVRGMLAGLGD